MKNQKGVTLIELVVAVALVAVVVASAAIVLDFGTDTFTAVGSKDEITTQANNIQTLITSKVRGSSGIILNGDFELVLEDVNGEDLRFLFTSGTQTLDFINDTTSETRVLGENVMDASFTAVGTDGVKLDMTLVLGDQQYRFITQAYKKR